MTRDGTAEPVSRDQILRHVRGQGNIHFPCPADHVQDWQPYPVDPFSAVCDDHTQRIWQNNVTFSFYNTPTGDFILCYLHVYSVPGTCLYFTLRVRFVTAG